jgi:hypothetical protein
LKKGGVTEELVSKYFWGVLYRKVIVDWRADVYKKCLLANSLPDPLFRYFSNAKALYLLEKLIVKQTDTGSLDFVDSTSPRWCLANRAEKSCVQPL